MRSIREDAHTIINTALADVMPEAAVQRALSAHKLNHELTVIAIGKAAWNMAKAASAILGKRVRQGIVLTKYEHAKGPIDNMEIHEAGHPIPDLQSVAGAKRILEMVQGLTPDDQILLLISGGGSALLELPLDGVTLDEIQEITSHLLKVGANITEINTIRKHLSAVKGGRLAAQCNGAAVLAILLSDVIGDDPGVIASGPVHPDPSTSTDALDVLRKYNLNVSQNVLQAIGVETPKSVINCTTEVVGGVFQLCQSAAFAAETLGYRPTILSATITCEAREAGIYLASIAREMVNGTSKHANQPPCAVIAGGETVVHLRGNGKGGRNQELALAAASGIEGIANLVIFSIGSDGTDGPTDAAGGIVDGQSMARMRIAGTDPELALQENNAYMALQASGDLIITGPTGTNVNDLMVLLMR